MTGATPRPVIEKVLTAYGVSYVNIHDPQKGYRNQSFAVERDDGHLLNLILYKSEPGILARIQAANAVSDYLAARGFPSRRTANSRIVRLQSPGRQKFGALYHYLDGQTIPWEAYNQDHIKLLGKTMSDMHAALADFRTADLPDVADEYLEIVHRMRRYFADEAVQQALNDKLLLHVVPGTFSQFELLLRTAKLLPAQQPLHMDFVRSNILFQDDPLEAGGFKVRISGILDFEKTALGHPLLDVARTLAFLLVDCKYKQPQKVRKYFLGSGYIKRGQGILPAKHLSMLEPLVELFLFYDLYKFLRHNPYESLPDNEHFIRTVQMLIPRHLVVPTTSVAQ